MKKVLIVSYYFPPMQGAGVQRVAKFAKYLSEFGWFPVVLTVESQTDAGHVDSGEESINMKVCRTQAFLPANLYRTFISKSDKGEQFNNRSQAKGKGVFSFLKKIVNTYYFNPDEFIGWKKYAVKKGIELVKSENIDCIFATGPPNTDFIIGRDIAQKTGVKLICDFRDLWDQYSSVYNPLNSGYKRKKNRRQQKQIYEAAEKIITVSNTMNKQITDDYPTISTDKMEVIENGFDPEDFPDSEKKRSGPTKIFHFGTLTDWRSPEKLYTALQALRQNEPLVFNNLSLTFLGDVPPHYQNMAKRYSINSNIEFSGFMSYNEGIKKLVSEADIGLVILGDLDVNTNMLTSKLFDYIGAKLPLFVLAGEGELKDFVLKHKIGLVCDPNNIEEIKSGLKYIGENFSEFSKRVEFSGLEDFERRNLTEKLASILDKTMHTVK